MRSASSSLSAGMMVMTGPSTSSFAVRLRSPTPEQFARLLEAQDYACGMCHEPFEDGQLFHIDHDHDCCKAKNRSCGKCVRGLLCHTCNITLGHIERRRDLARAYLDSPPGAARREGRTEGA